MEKCKKAARLKSIDELNLPKRKVEYLFRWYKDLPEIVYAGRKFAYESKRWWRIPTTVPLTLFDLKDALEKKGYIRNDINDYTFGIGTLYKRVYGSDLVTSYPYSFNCLDNEKYETIENPSVEVSNKVVTAIRNHRGEFTPLELKALGSVYALAPNEEMRTYKEIAKKIGEKIKSVEAADHMAIQKLRQYNILPAIMEPDEEWICKLEEVITRLKEIHEDPIVKERDTCISRLSRYEKLPFEFPQNLSKYFRSGAFDTRDIDCLNLGITTEFRLKAAGIQTISDLALIPDYCLENINHLNEEDTRLIRFILKNLH